MIEPLVLLPGMMCDARLFAPQVAHFSAQRAVTVAPVSLGERVEEIASNLLDQLPARFAVAGQGLGGNVALELLRRAPDRIGRLCLMGTSPLPATPAAAAEREPQIVRARAGRLDEVLRETVTADLLAPTAQRVDLLAQLHAMGQALGADVFQRQSRTLQRLQDQQGVLRRCKVPALILCGAQDPRHPIKRQSFLAELIEGAVLHVVPDAAHFPCLEQPDSVIGALTDWLDGGAR